MPSLGELASPASANAGDIPTSVLWASARPGVAIAARRSVRSGPDAWNHAKAPVPEAAVWTGSFGPVRERSRASATFVSTPSSRLLEAGSSLSGKHLPNRARAFAWFRAQSRAELMSSVETASARRGRSAGTIRTRDLAGDRLDSRHQRLPVRRSPRAQASLPTRASPVPMCSTFLARDLKKTSVLGRRSYTGGTRLFCRSASNAGAGSDCDRSVSCREGLAMVGRDPFGSVERVRRSVEPGRVARGAVHAQSPAQRSLAVASAMGNRALARAARGPGRPVMQRC